MKNFITLLGVLLFVYGSAQTTNVTYTASTAVISNPERGFFKFTSTDSGTYDALNQTTLTNYRLNNNITLIYREFSLKDFITSPISATYLANMQSDFTKLRNAGLKAVIRFTYSNDQDVAQRDATKALMLSHILQLKPVLETNADVIATMQAGFIGAWGEWYYTSQPEFGGNGYNGTNLTTANINNRRDIVNAILAALPASRTVSIRTPTIKQELYSQTALTSTQAFNESNIARIGHHNDCFLASADDEGTYDNVTTQYPYLAQETKFLPMGGETCGINSPRSDCATALVEMEKFHWSMMNLDYYPAVIDGFENGNCFPDMQKKLGYRFQLNSAILPNAVALGTQLAVTLKIKNTGFAAPYNERHAYIVLKNLSTNQVYPILMATDPRTWLGPNEIAITENLTLPSNLTTGNYKMYLSLPDDSPSLAAKPEFAIRLANESMWESTTGYNTLNQTLNVTGALGVADNDAKLDMTIYPVPTNNELNIELEGIADYKVSFYNSMGQTVKVSSTTESNKVIVNTGNLSEGLYFVELAKGSVKDTRKIIVKH